LELPSKCIFDAEYTEAPALRNHKHLNRLISNLLMKTAHSTPPMKSLNAMLSTTMTEFFISIVVSFQGEAWINGFHCTINRLSSKQTILQPILNLVIAYPFSPIKVALIKVDSKFLQNSSVLYPL
jgi:hypothetical protein